VATEKVSREANEETMIETFKEMMCKIKSDPKRNLEGNYKIKMIKARNKSLRSRYRWKKEQYMYQAHIF